jgi:hypothetical protein
VTNHGGREVHDVELKMRMSDKARDYVEEIVHEMLVRFPITRDEAVSRPLRPRTL